MKRLELGRIHVCSRCGRSAAELRGPDGESLAVPLDPVRARELLGTMPPDGLHSLPDLVLEQLGADNVALSEVVLDVADGRIRGLLTLVRGGEPDVIGCTAEEGVTFALRGKVKLYATDEALAHGAAHAAKPERHGGGPDTVH